MKRLAKLFNLYFLNSEVLTKENKSLIFKSLATLSLLIFIINILYLKQATDLVVDTNLRNLTQTVEEISIYDDDIDLTFVANLLEANHIEVLYENDMIIKYHRENNILSMCGKHQNTFLPLIGSKYSYNNWYISSSFNLVMFYDVDYHLKGSLKSNQTKFITFELPIPCIIITDMIFKILSSFLFVFSTTIMVIFITSQVRISDLISKAGNEAMLSSKNNQKFTEAMHHEVKTPLSVLNSGFDRMEILIEDLWANINNYSYIKSRLLSDKEIICKIIDMVDLNFGIIYNILDKQRNNRAIRYSNGNYNLYDLLQHSFEGLKWDTKIKYIYDIDEKLKLVSNSDTGLTNEDFTNIATNHIRNALEANANNVKVVLESIEGNLTSIYLADNGKGMSDEVSSMVYLPNFSTKKELKDSDNQGIGMYLCQTLLNEVGGYEKVEQSGNSGTIFRLVFPTMQYKG